MNIEDYMYIIVSPFSKTFDEIWLIYFVPDFLVWELEIWCIVEIPLKDLIEIWVVLKIINNNDLELNIEKIKSIISIKNENIFIKEYQIKLIPWISEYYFTPIHNSVNLFFPKNLREKILKDKIPLIPFIKWETNRYEYLFNFNITLTDKQNDAYNKIKTNINKILLNWITWSWKTEIYIKLIKDTIDLNKQALLLIPEIILTNQISSKLKKVFGNDIIIINSTISNATKTKYWSCIYNSDAKIIIGTRSALFYPYNNLWLIIIDEEHDNSYISSSAPRYNGIEIANKISDLTWAKLILASWTPSIKNMYKALKGDYEIVSLLEKFNPS